MKPVGPTKVGKYIPCGYSVSTIWAFDGIENKHDVYRGKDCKFCESLEEHAMKIIHFEERKMILLTNKEFESYASQENCHICKRNFEDK